jgi:hypothetical protein
MGSIRDSGAAEKEAVGVSETDIRKAIQLAHSKGDTRLFRNQVGEGWVGRSYRRPDGSVTIINPRRIIFGLAPGSADLIGWRTVEITPAMVGQRLAVFASIEVKTGRGRYGHGQPEWASAVTAAGGLAGFAKGPAEAGRILEGLDDYDT